MQVFRPRNYSFSDTIICGILSVYGCFISSLRFLWFNLNSELWSFTSFTNLCRPKDLHILSMLYASSSYVSERFLVGQNLYIYKQSRKSADTDWERAITDWYNEVELFGKERVKPFKYAFLSLKTHVVFYNPRISRFSTDVGHYTAMVWSNTNKVGCGVTEYIDGKWFAKLYTCNYGPAGKIIIRLSSL